MPSTKRRVVTKEPRNLETAPAALLTRTTPAAALFVRNHGDEPRPRRTWTIRVTGPKKTFDVSLADLKRSRTKNVAMVLECAGNGRGALDPPVPGVQWGRDALGCATFRGVALAPLLRRAGFSKETSEVVFTGADDGDVPFQRSLPLAKALDPDTILAIEMDGQGLSREHGGPVRLVVPRWFGIASVKWLSEVRVATEPFQGKYQTQSYVYRRRSDQTPDSPVGPLLVKSRIVAPRKGHLVAGRPVEVWGWAWTGDRHVKRVEVSTDAGQTWHDARLERSAKGAAWQQFAYRWTPLKAGRRTLMSRATDAGGDVQPLRPVWNELGYGNNAVEGLDVLVASPGTRRAPRGRTAVRLVEKIQV